MLLSVRGLTIAIPFLIGLPKTLQSVLNSAARLIARLHRDSHISSFIKEQLYWLPISPRIEHKGLLLILKAQLGVAPKYLQDSIIFPCSATSLRPLRSLDRRDLLVPEAKTTMVKSRCYWSIYVE